MDQNERQQRILERIQEDESLRGDLEDTAATALLNWAAQQVQQVTSDPVRPDTEVDAEVLAIRAAARAAAQSGENDPKRVVALAEAHLKQHDRTPRAASNIPVSHATRLPAAEQATRSTQRCNPRTYARRNQRLARLIRRLRGEN